MPATTQGVQILEDEGLRASAPFSGDSAIEGKKILVTGASGLIGTGLVAALRSLNSGASLAKIYAQILSEAPAPFKKWEEEGSVQLQQANLADPASWEKLPEADIIIHAAGYGQPGRFLKDPLTPLMLNTGCSIALLKKLKPGGSFLFLSSTEVYQGLDKKLLSEEDIGTTSPDHPRSGYIEGKRCGEALCHAARQSGIRAMAVRLAHTYGPGTRANDRRVINMFIEKAIVTGRIEMLDHGEAIRTWGYITDVVEHCLAVLFRGQQAVYNVGGHSCLTIRALAEEIGKQCGVEVVLPQTSVAVEGAPAIVEADLSRIEKEFGKNRYIDLGEGLEKTIAYQRCLYGK